MLVKADSQSMDGNDIFEIATRGSLYLSPWPKEQSTASPAITGNTE